MTTQQMDLMYEHYLLDQKPRPKTYNDPDYSNEEPVNEHFEDPDFDKAWDADDDESIGENDSIIVPPEPMERIDLNESYADEEPVNDVDDWEEV